MNMPGAVRAATPAAVEADPAPAPVLDERVVGFGEGLVGVLTVPTGRTPRRTAVVLLNAGLVHRMGPFRLYVQLARRLAAKGYVVLRFDQSGLGDSPLSSRLSESRKRDEIGAAMDAVTHETGVGRFVLGGVCSGADDAFNLAPQDPRVAGVVLLDGVGYVTRGHRIRHYLPRLFNPARVWRALRRRLRKGDGEPRAVGNDDLRDFPRREEAVGRLHALDARGTQVLMLYTGGVASYHNHRRQAREAFGRVMDSPNMASEYWPECDHTFYVRAHREQLFACLQDWMGSRFAE